MAHKTRSKEQFVFKFYHFAITFTLLQSEKEKRGEIEGLRRNETRLWYLREVPVQRVRVEDAQVSGKELIY